MRGIRILLLVTMIACLIPFFAYAADTAPAPEWDQVLDQIYSHTWRGRAELSEQLNRQESRIRQTLPDYIAAWDRRTATPAVYLGTDTGGAACGPLRYCAGDFLDARGFILKLQEKKNQLARSLFDKLSPDARKTVMETDLAGQGQSAKTVQILADEMTRIVREDTFYSSGSRENRGLSPAATAVAQDSKSAMNRICINKTIIAEAFPAELARNFKCVLQKDESYRRLVAAKTVQFLRTGDRRYLDEAVGESDVFANKLIYTDFAFWYYYPRALADIENNNSSAFTVAAYKLLNDVVLWEEPLEAGKTSPAEMERRHYAWNLADLVLTRAILEKKMGGLEVLGPAVWILGSRSKEQAIGEQEKRLLRFSIDVRKYLSGPESDNYRLNFAVALCEGNRLYALLMQALEAKQSGEPVRILFEESREYFQLTNEWAGTWQGKATAVTANLELVNAGLAKMKEILPQPELASLAGAPDKDTLGMALALYRGMAERESGGWEQLRFVDRKVYIDSAQNLWNAVRRNSLLVADYHLERMDRDDFQSVMDNSMPAEKSLQRYVSLFKTYAAADGTREMIPDSAYFAYAEALKRLSRLELNIYSFNSNMQLHTQSVDFLLDAIAVYPYDESLSEYAALSRNINTGSVMTYPDAVVRSVVSNRVVAKCLQGNKSYCDATTRQALEWHIRKVRNKLYSSNNANVLDDMKLLASDLGNGTQPSGKGKSLQDSQLQSILGSLGRYIAQCEELSVLSASAEEQYRKCSAEGAGCNDLEAATARLLPSQGKLERQKDELVAACNKWVGRQDADATNVAGGKELETVRSLSSLVVDEYVSQSDRVVKVVVRKKLNELSQADNHPMHKIIRSGYYASKL